MPTVSNKLTKKKAEDVEHYEHLPLAVVNTIVVVVERRGASVPCLLCHCFLIHVFLHLKVPGSLLNPTPTVSRALKTRPGADKSCRQSKVWFRKE